MRWPWTRDPHDQAANEQAEQDLKKIRGQWPRVREQTARMDRHREINGFTHAIREAMGVER